jgi:Fe-S cluster assembly ATP-binding protein
MKKNIILKIEDLKVSINDKEILKGLDLEIKEGEIHVLM